MMLTGAAAAALTWSSDALAQDEGGATVEGVVVTARKRNETDISVPVAVTAFSQTELAQKGTGRVQDVALLDPSLTVSQSASAGGGAMYMRGVGTATGSNATFDQAVLLEIDGVPYSNGNLLRIGHYDLEQIQIIKGPQALFFGKNSPAGVVSMTTANPTSEPFLSGKFSYEPYAKETLVEGVVSGPITDSFGARLFANYTLHKGSDRNLAAVAAPTANAILPGTVTLPRYSRSWRRESQFVRLTLAYEPNDRLNARAKFSYHHQKSPGVGAIKERYYCDQGRAQNTTAAILALGAGNPNVPALASALSVDDCKLNGTVYYGGINPVNFRAPWLTDKDRKSEGFMGENIFTGSLEAQYEISDTLTLDSVTGLGQILNASTTQNNFAVPATPALILVTRADIDQFTQELRLSSSYSGRVNFVVGGFYQDSEFSGYTANAALAPFTHFHYTIPGKTESIFAQLIWQPAELIEIAGGARYTRERRSLLLQLQDAVNTSLFTTIPTQNPMRTVEDVSPEATVTFRPSTRLTIFGAYRSGFKSGGYGQTLVSNAAIPSSTPPLYDTYYEPESGEGFEGGVKLSALDRALRVDTNVYSYKYDDLQVNFVDSSSGAPFIRIANAASSTVKGVEVNATYTAPDGPLSGLVLRLAGNYNRAKYKEFLSPCFIGQSVAEGCNLTPNATGAFTAQDLAGRTLTNAPRWTGYLGLTYTRDLNNGLRLRLGADAAYKSSYNPTPDLIPWARQSPATLFGLEASIADNDGAWEFAVIGRNLGDVYRAQENSNVPFTGNAANTGTVRGGVGSHADLAGNTNQGRAIYFQLTVRPSEWMRRD